MPIAREFALINPTEEQLEALVAERCKDGLWKIGGCYEDQLDIRPSNAAQYSPDYFDRLGAICLARGIPSKKKAESLETAAIQQAMLLDTSVNDKKQDAVPHGGYCPARPGAVYAVPVVARITTPAQFKDEYVSYYKKTLRRRCVLVHKILKI
eukprot:SAG31_NODE_7481_length_1678_cov_4.905636_2_plen_153_part_00